MAKSKTHTDYEQNQQYEHKSDQSVEMQEILQTVKELRGQFLSCLHWAEACWRVAQDCIAMTGELISEWSTDVYNIMSSTYDTKQSDNILFW